MLRVPNWKKLVSEWYILLQAVSQNTGKYQENEVPPVIDGPQMDINPLLALPFDAVKDLPYDDFMRWQTAQERSRKERKIINGLRVVA